MLEIKVDSGGEGPLYQQINGQIKKLITSGQLKPGEQIPSVRDLASWLKVNPSTVARAYYDLKREGLVATSRRQGTIIKGDGDYFLSTAQGAGELSWTGDNDRPDTFHYGSSLQDLEVAFTLHPSRWRVQRTG